MWTQNIRMWLYANFVVANNYKFYNSGIATRMYTTAKLPTMHLNASTYYTYIALCVRMFTHIACKVTNLVSHIVGINLTFHVLFFL